MKQLLFVEALRPGEIILVTIVAVIILIIPLVVAYRLGYYKGKDAAHKEDRKTKL